VEEFTKELGKRALVIGGSITGMLTARVLSDFFGEVIIIEKGSKSDKQIPRTEVPQGSQGHALLKHGEEILEHFFPGIVEELIEDGSVKSDFTNDLTWNHHGKWKVKFSSGFSIIQQSRPFLEWHIQRRLNMIRNISHLMNSQAKQLLLNANNTEVVGVKVTQKDLTEVELFADLVVDASGAGSNISSWIQQFGYPSPEKTEVKVNLFYSSRIYRKPNSDYNNIGSILVYPNPPLKKCGGGLSPIEKDRVMVTVFGYGFESIPKKEADFLQFAKNLQQKDIYNFILNAQPDNDVQVYRFPVLRRIHFEKLKRFPDRLIMIGDAFCRIDPIFGQGMSIAALETVALKKELEKRAHRYDLSRISHSVHRRFSKVIDIPWLIALSEDFRYEHTQGPKPVGLSFLMWYVKKVILACEVNQIIYTKLINVLHLKAHPITLFAPSVLKAVFIGAKKSK
jgi:2-polyprenyl-6-methoxyphenol hydroxylase-like FAD-dependent oxidoreductase